MADTEFRVETRPADAQVRRNGRWVKLLEQLRTLQPEQCVAFEGSPHDCTLAQAQLYSHRQLRVGEKVHLSYVDGVIRVWMTRNGQSG